MKNYITQTTMRGLSRLDLSNIFQYGIMISLMIFSFFQINAQQVPLEWSRLYNGTGNLYDEAASMRVDAMGNSYVTGKCFNNGSEAYCTIKYNSAGVSK